MNKWKKILLGTTIAGAVTVGSGVIGTYSWFTSESEANGTMVNGTFSSGEMGQLFDHKQFAPSQLLFSDWQTVDNTGDLDQLLKATYTHQVNKKDIDINKYKVGYTALKYTEKPDEDELNDQKYELEKLLDGTTNPINPFHTDSASAEIVRGVLTNEDVNALSVDNSSNTITLGDADAFWSLKSDEYIDIVFGVKLSEEAGNQFQAVQYDGKFKVDAKQTDEGAAYNN